MAAGFAASIVNALLGSALGPAGPGTSNRVGFEGLSMVATEDGGLEIRIDRLEAAALRLTSGPLTLELGRFELNELVAQVRIDAGTPRLRSLDAAQAELAGVKMQGIPAPPAPAFARRSATTAGPWCLGALAAADGTLRAEIVDAHLLFDADVTVPVRQGQIDFRDASVEHVGPDSRMGVSRLGLYVDAPNGRSYLYQFPSAPVDGVEYERRGAVPGPWVTDRGKLRLQPFGESLLGHSAAAPAMGFTQQARQLFDRTAVSGELQLGDGRLAVPGLQAEFAGRADRRNLVRLHSEAVGRGFTLEMGSLSVRDAVLGAGDRHMRCDALTGAITLRVFIEGGQLRLGLDVAKAKMSGLHLQA